MSEGMHLKLPPAWILPLVDGFSNVSPPSFLCPKVKENVSVVRSLRKKRAETMESDKPAAALP